MYVCMCMCIYIYVCVCANISVHVKFHANVKVYICAYVHTSLHVYIYIYTGTYSRHIYIYIHIYIYRYIRHTYGRILNTRESLLTDAGQKRCVEERPLSFTLTSQSGGRNPITFSPDVLNLSPGSSDLAA